MRYLEGLRPDVKSDPTLALEVASGYAHVGRSQGVPAYPNLGQPKEAQQSLRVASQILTDIRSANPDSQPAELLAAEVAHDLALLADGFRDIEEAAAQAIRAVTWIAPLAAKPNRSAEENQSLSRVLSNTTLTLNNIDDWEGGLRAARACADAFENQPGYLGTVVYCKSLLANALRFLGRLDEAHEAIADAHSQLDHVTGRSDNERASIVYGVLWRYGMILGEHDAISLGRNEEAAALMQQALDLMDSLAAKDPNEGSSRVRLATAGRELAKMVEDADPGRALSVQRHCLNRLCEINSLQKSPRQLWHLAGAGSALRKLGRLREAEAQFESAFALMTDLDIYPANSKRLSAEVRAVLRAWASHLTATGRATKALDVLRELEADAFQNPDKPEVNLRDANNLVRIWLLQAEAHTALGSMGKSAAFTVEANELRRRWDQRLPGNPFIRAQLARTAAPLRAGQR